EQNVLPELVDQARESERHGIRIGPAARTVRFDEALAQRSNRVAERLVALTADARIILASLRLGEERVPHGNFLRIAQPAAEARVDDRQQTAQSIVARIRQNTRDLFRKFFG